MDPSIKRVNFTLKQLEGLPLFIKTIYFNEMVNLDDENKLMKFNNNLNTVQMRHYEPSRIICKSVNLIKFKKDQS